MTLCNMTHVVINLRLNLHNNVYNLTSKPLELKEATISFSLLRLQESWSATLLITNDKKNGKQKIKTFLNAALSDVNLISAK